MDGANTSWILTSTALVLFMTLRVSEEEETQGLDVVLHSESGYDL